MEALALLRMYVTANVLLLLAFGGLIAVRSWSRKSDVLGYRGQLVLAYVLTVGAIALSALSVLPGVDLVPDAAQVWSAPTMQHASTLHAAEPRTTMSLSPAGFTLGLSSVGWLFVVVVSTGAIIVLVRTIVDLRAIRRTLVDAQIIRRIGRLSLRSSETIDVPFSFWLPGRYLIVVPSVLMQRPRDLKMAIRHEGEHHRRGDTKVLYLYRLLSAAFFWNPVAHLLARHMHSIQEFACDEAVTQRHAASTSAYCRCLLWVAEHALQRRASVCMGMAGRARGTLTRRIEALVTPGDKTMKPAKVAMISAVGIASMALTALALGSTVKDRRISFEDASRMATRAQATRAQRQAALRVEINDSVLRHLNRFLGTPDGRLFFRESLARMQPHHEVITAKLREYGLPVELLAVPIVESGYRNLPASGKSRTGAGIWMFIAPTARKFDLRVDDRVDERLDVPLETDAAMRMLSGLNTHFGDWGLALLAYNSGSAMVEQGIRETGTRDVWELVRSGYENDPDYVPRVMAAILIMHDPSVLE